MKLILIIFILALVGCTSNEKKTSEGKMDTFSLEPASSDTIVPDESTALPTEDTSKNDVKKESPSAPKPQVYSNKRFKEVTVERLPNNKFRVKGKGQIFEASFSWVIEDGHNEIKKGFETTDMGAPEWGNFNFVISAVKQRQNSTLHLILYETSAKDGSRQYQLPIKLY